MNLVSKYRFSFTAGALLHSEMVTTANELIQQNYDFTKLNADILNKERLKTSKREFAEVSLRLNTLDEQEVQFLVYGTKTISKQIALLACVRAYGFIKDFLTHVVLEKVTLFDYSITDRDYTSFVRNMELEHPELEELTDNTKYKIKQVLFKILAQANLIDSIKTKNITPNYLEFELSAWLSKKDKANEIKLLLG